MLIKQLFTACIMITLNPLSATLATVLGLRHRVLVTTLVAKFGHCHAVFIEGRPLVTVQAGATADARLFSPRAEIHLCSSVSHWYVIVGEGWVLRCSQCSGRKV